MTGNFISMEVIKILLPKNRTRSRLRSAHEKARSRRSSALVLVLITLVLISVLVISLLIMAQDERTSSNLSTSRTQGSVLADFAADTAMERLREAIDSGRQFNATSYTTWSSEPGRIHVFTIAQGTGAISKTDYNMFSAPPGADDANTSDLNNVDLNRPSLSGIYPVTGSVPGNMKIGWISLLANPALAASQSNPVIGRIAYWVDDETCKVNINTADGSKKGPVDTANYSSYGFGTPSEVSLAALPGMGTLNPLTNAAAIAAYAAGTGFDSATEVARVNTTNGYNVSSDFNPQQFYQTNTFNITYTSKTPEINMFGEPRIYLFSGGGNNYMMGPYAYYGTNTAYNFAANVSKPVNFIYPISGSSATTAQLPTNTPPSAPSPQPSAAHRPQYLPQSISPDFNNQWAGSSQNWAFTGTPTALYSGTYPIASRIAAYLNGTNSADQAITWPQFAGSTVSGFAGKYTPRQLDNMAFQIVDMVGRATIASQIAGYSPPYLIGTGRGILDTADVNFGIGRTPKLTEVYVNVSSGTGSINSVSVPYLTMTIVTEFYLPKYYSGEPIQSPYDNAIIGGVSTPSFESSWEIGSLNPGDKNMLNVLDVPGLESDAGGTYIIIGGIPSSGGSALGGYTAASATSTNFPFWMNNLLQVYDQTGTTPAGIDFFGNPAGTGASPIPDPDQINAALYHPYRLIGSGPNTGKYAGNGPGISSGAYEPVAYMSALSANTSTWYPGTYHALVNVNRAVTYYGAPGVTAFKIQGGISAWVHPEMGGVFKFICAPMDSITGPNAAGVPATTNNPVNPSPAQFGVTGQNITPTTATPTARATALAAVVPISLDVPVGSSATIALGVSDPLVNEFPGDWITEYKNDANGTTGSTSSITLPTSFSSSAPIVYAAGGAAAIDPTFPKSGSQTAPVNASSYNGGDNIGYLPANGGDPLSVWMPRQDIRIPKQAIFPSVGALGYIHTGVVPDTAGTLTSTTAGTPWRTVSFAPANSAVGSGSVGAGQKTANGIYPDWAMLDLFTVPFLPQPASTNAATQSPPRYLTFGGATEGRININNPAVPYPFSQTFSGVTQTPPQRIAPLEALFYGIQPSTSYDANSNPIRTTIDSTTAATLASAVQTYLAANGPFMIPGQLAEVPGISAYTYQASYMDSQGASHTVSTRNDLMREVVGAATTQSNTYSVWVVAQTIKKKPGNTNYGVYEAGDTVAGEVRRRYLIERFIQTGKDGVPGNGNPLISGAAGADGIVGTADDLVSSGVNGYHPAMTYPLPYRWRILSVQDETQ